jgi:hypothetical protein
MRRFALTFIIAFIALTGCGSSSATNQATQIYNSMKAVKFHAVHYVLDGTLASHNGKILQDIAFIAQPRTIAFASTVTDPTGTHTTNVIETDTGSYISDPPGQWHSTSTRGTYETKKLDPNAEVATMTLDAVPTLVGKETINNRATYHISMPISQLPAAVAVNAVTTTNVTGTADIWIAQDNYYVIKLIANYTQPSSNGDHVSGVMHLNVLEWDKDVHITIPTDAVPGG